MAARLEDEASGGLARLGELGISGDRLVTFLSNSVAARLDDEAFWAGLARLGELGISGDGVTFMSTRWRRGWRTRRSGQGWRGWVSLASRGGWCVPSDSVAARLDDEAFWARAGAAGASLASRATGW